MQQTEKVALNLATGGLGHVICMSVNRSVKALEIDTVVA